MKYGTMSYLSVNGEVLMIRKIKRENDPNSDFYTLPGGKLMDLEKGISQFGRLKSAIRETEEETGLKLLAPKLRGIILFDNSDRIFDNWKNPDNYLVYIFVARSYNGQLKSKTDEGVPVWINNVFIDAVRKNAGDKKIYEWLKNQKPFTGVIKHKGKTLDEAGTFVDYF